MSEQEIEKRIQDKGLNAPRLTPALIDAKVKSVEFHVFKATCLTVCCMTLENGFTVTGESACASAENFDAEIGRDIAFKNAREKIWVLEGYLLKQKLHDTPVDFKDRVRKERDELCDKIEALTGFIKSKPDFVSADELSDLESQAIHMMSYFKVLNIHISAFT